MENGLTKSESKEIHILSDNINFIVQLNAEVLAIKNNLERISNNLFPMEGDGDEGCCCSPEKELLTQIEIFNNELIYLHNNVVNLQPSIVNLFAYIYSEEIANVIDEVISNNIISCEFNNSSLGKFDINLSRIKDNIYLLNNVYNILDKILFSYTRFEKVSEKDIVDIITNRSEDIIEKELDKSDISIVEEMHNKLCGIEFYIDSIRATVEKIEVILK